MTEIHLLYWPTFAILTLFAYWLPGYAVMQLVNVGGGGRMTKFLLAVPLSLVVIPYLMVTVGNLVHFRPTLVWLFGFSAAIGGVGRLLRYFGLAPSLEICYGDEGIKPPASKELALVLVFVLAFATWVS